MAVETARQAPPDAAAAQTIMRVGMGYILSAALNVAIKLDVATSLGSGPHSTAEMAKEKGVLEDPLYRVLRALASVGIFEEVPGRRFRNTPASELLRAGTATSMRAIADFMSEPFHFRVQAEAMHSVRTGEPAAEKVAGEPLFQYFPKHPELGDLFNDAMTSLSRSLMPAVLKAYDFSGIDRLVDVAGGHGIVLTSILKEHPAMHGTLFDLPHVIEGARPKIEAAGLASRCDTVAGDFFKSVPAGGDAYVLKHIIHDWNDERAAVILRNIRAALDGRPNGRVILLEGVIHPGNDPDFAKVLDLEMLLFPGGRERTAEEFSNLFAAAGFRLERIVPTESHLSVVEAVPV